MYQRRPRIFRDTFRCHSVSMLAAEMHRDVETLESCDKIILPPSALEKLAHLEISYPMLFEITNPKSTALKLTGGVLEFVAQEGMVYMPSWMMQNMNIHEGDLISLRSATVPKGTYVKLQPQKTSFIQLQNPKAVLEATLRKFSALTKGEMIRIFYNQKEYDIAIVDVKAEGGAQTDAVCIIEADVEVDFVTPADHVEPAPTSAPQQQPIARPIPNALFASPPSLDGDSSDEGDGFKAFQGKGFRLDGKKSIRKKKLAPIPLAKPAATTSTVPTSPRKSIATDTIDSGHKPG